jgi:hypothetical protein
MSTSDFIFRPVTNKPVDSSNTEHYYCIFGEHDFIDDQNNPRMNKESPKTLAKYIDGEISSRYFIKVGTHGRIYNPIGMYSEGNESRFLAKIGKNEWSFKSVNKDIFDKYVNFLRTKNIAWLNNAERDMI